MSEKIVLEKPIRETITLSFKKHGPGPINMTILVIKPLFYKIELNKKSLFEGWSKK